MCPTGHIYRYFKFLEEQNMATVIRLTRMGRTKKPFYRIVVTDSRKRRDGGWIEELGYYNPMTEPKVLKVDADRLAYWKGVGAQMSEKVANLTK
jgi:small subunit ribosomal protein S16